MTTTPKTTTTSATAVATATLPMTTTVVETTPYTPEDRQRWKQLLLAKGREVSKKLEEVLAGKDVDLNRIGLVMAGEPALSPEKRLRRYLDLLMKRMRAVEHPKFGYDPSRGAFLSVAELDQVPWIEVEPF